jgi:aminopeptidase N
MLFLAGVLAAALSARANTAVQETHYCRFCAPSPAPLSVESPLYRKYAPDKRVEVQHLELDITPDFQKRTLTGSATLRFQPIGKPLDELRLDAIDLSVHSITSSETGLRYQAGDREIVLSFLTPVPVGKEVFVTVQYSAEPVKGMYFRTKEMGYSYTHLWTQGETNESRHWFPCLDYPLAKFTSQITCHLPEGMVSLSNGRQLPSTHGTDGLEVHHWIQDKPHANYLVTLVAGEFTKVEDQLRDIPLQFWTTPDQSPQAANSFRNTKNIMEFFERETGIPYPWAKYAQVVIHDFHWGGMENTSLTTLTTRTLFTPETENLFDSNSLVAHELAHQWFGDFVTCKDWSHTWLNEGFATYYDWLWQGHFHGEDETLFHLYNAANGILANTNETRGIVYKKYTDPGEMFSYLSYPKGAWVLHMLRSELGPDLYRSAIHNYLERHAYGSVTSDDLRAAVESVSGRSFERFFDQWVNGVGAPQLDVDFSWDEKSHLAKVSIKQTQKISEEAPLFQFPLALRFTVGGVPHERVVQILNKNEDFYIPLPTAPTGVRVNPRQTVLAKIKFKPSRPMVLQQLADNTDCVGQLQALDLIAEKPDQQAVTKILETLQSATHYGVRVAAAEALQKARSPEALNSLLESRSQPDARVRNAIAKALGGYFEPSARNALLSLASDKNPGIAATALRGLGPYQTGEVQAALLLAVATPSFRERLAEGALAAIKAQDDPDLLTPLIATLRQRTSTLPSPTLASGLETVGTLARNDLKKDEPRDLLLSFLSHPKELIRIAAINALGNLEDPRAIAMLETFSAASSYRPEKVPAENALAKIRAARRPSEELKSLRTEFSSLQDTARELKKDLDKLQKQVEGKP